MCLACPTDRADLLATSEDMKITKEIRQAAGILCGGLIFGFDSDPQLLAPFDGTNES